MTEIIFDKSYWPKSGTIVDALPTDLSDLWEHFPEQASVFVAEALIASPPRSHVALGTANIETYLWDVGGDVVCVSEPLAPLIEAAATDYVAVRSDEQKEDLLERRNGLMLLQTAIENACQIIDAQINQYDGKK